jgi:hypothetical protein
MSVVINIPNPVVTVADITERDAIPSGERYIGLGVYVLANPHNIFRLVGGIANSNWEREVPATLGGGNDVRNIAWSADNSALKDNTTGIGNIAIGTESLFKNTTGVENMSIGFRALYSNVNGNYNVGIGTGALFTNVSGQFNVGVGQSALVFNTASNNTGLGHGALENLTTGSENTAMGKLAGAVLVTGSNNIAIGANTNFGASNNTNTIVIGAGATSGASNTTTIGTASTTSARLRGAHVIDSFADVSAPVNSLYFSTTANRLVWKDSFGIVNNLY